MALSAGLSLASGVAGLLGASSAARQQAAYQKAAADALKARTRGMNQALSLARNYDPRAESQAAVDYASATAADRLGKSLADLNQRFRNAGGSPGGDSLFRVQAQGVANRVADPLKAFAAEQASQSTARKLDALGTAMGMGGDLAGGYSQLAQQYQPDYAGSVEQFASGFGRLSDRNLWKKFTPLKTTAGTVPSAGGK